MTPLIRFILHVIGTVVILAVYFATDSIVLLLLLPLYGFIMLQVPTRQTRSKQ